MSAEDTKVIQYDDKDFHALMQEFKSLSTFKTVATWDQRTRAEVDRIVEVVRDLDTEIARQLDALEKAKSEHAQKSLLKRTFSSRKSEKDIAQHIDQCRQHKTTLEGMAAKLQEAIDFTPNSTEEQKALLKELRLRKKELQAEKREVAASMKAIRTEARQQSAQAGRVLGIVYDSKLAASQRRRIRYTREAALGPHEDAKTAIERQILQVDRDILWAERFSE